MKNQLPSPDTGSRSTTVACFFCTLQKLSLFKQHIFINSFLQKKPLCTCNFSHIAPWSMVYAVSLDLLHSSTIWVPLYPMDYLSLLNHSPLACVHAKSLQSCLTLCSHMGCSPPGSSVHGILQAGILKCVAIPSSRGSSPPKDQTCVSCTGRWVLYH